MTTYEIYIKHASGKFDHIKTTTNKAEHKQIIREHTMNGETITVIERYSCGTTCRSEYKAN